MKSKKRASYKNGVIKMFLLVIIGMVIGGVTGKLYFTFGENMTGVTGSFLVVITKIMLPLLSLITVITVLGGEYCYNRLKKIGVKILETEDEECDKWEYEEERWGGSCDEAEKEVIYKSAYHTYVMMQRTIGILLVITMLLHLFFNTGLLAVIVVGVIYLVSTFSYTHSCVQLRKRKIS